MSATTMPARTLRSPVGSTTRWFLVSALQLARWLLGAAVLVLAVAVVIYGLASTTHDTSVVQFALQAIVWVPMSVFIGQSANYLPAHVASGLTRRTLARGALVAAVATGLGYGVAFAVLLLAERSVYGALGWQWSLGGNGGNTAAFVASAPVSFVAAYVAGLLIGAVYVRGGAWWGTLTLPLTAGPVALFLTASPWLDARQTLLAAAGGLVLAIVFGVIYDRVVRGSAVPTKK